MGRQIKTIVFLKQRVYNGDSENVVIIWPSKIIAFGKTTCQIHSQKIRKHALVSSSVTPYGKRRKCQSHKV